MSNTGRVLRSGVDRSFTLNHVPSLWLWWTQHQGLSTNFSCSCVRACVSLSNTLLCSLLFRRPQLTLPLRSTLSTSQHNMVDASLFPPAPRRSIANRTDKIKTRDKLRLHWECLAYSYQLSQLLPAMSHSSRSNSRDDDTCTCEWVLAHPAAPSCRLPVCAAVGVHVRGERAFAGWSDDITTNSFLPLKHSRPDPSRHHGRTIGLDRVHADNSALDRSRGL